MNEVGRKLDEGPQPKLSEERAWECLVRPRGLVS